MVTIYALRVLGTPFVYVGATTELKKRFNAHRSALLRRRHDNARLQMAFDGSEEKLRLKTLEKCSKDNSVAKEGKWIAYLSIKWRVVNMRPATRISALGFLHSAETKLRMSRARKGKATRKLSAAHMARMRAARGPIDAAHKERARQLGLAKARPVRNIDTGVVYASAVAAAAATGTLVTGISRVIRGLGRTANGFRWERA